MRGLSFRRKRKKINIAALQGFFVWIFEMALAFVMACVLVYFFGTALSNVGQSMEPEIYSGDKVLVNKIVYKVTSPDYGDLIVFKPNGNENSHYHIKRVAGLPGDTIHIESGRVFVNGELLDEKVTVEKMLDAGVAETEVLLGADEYFVLGDNRNQSEDSRSADIGNVNRKDILGKAWFVVSPRERFGWLH